MSPDRDRRWFLPETPDVVALLRAQAAITIEALDGFAAWAGGDPSAAAVVRDAEPRGDAAKRALLTEIRDAFVLELEPEDVFTLSRGIDWILDYARDVIEEAEALRCGPDPALAEMAGLLAEATRQIDRAIGQLHGEADAATTSADDAIKIARRIDHIYYRETAALLEVENTRERISRRELYRRSQRIGEIVIDVAERIVYSVVKES